MKNLSEVTKEDAREILSSYYLPGRWHLIDQQKELKEPVKLFYSKYNRYRFYFYDNKIQIESDGNIQAIDESTYDTNVDTNLQCYIRAYKLGYNVPELVELIDPIIKIAYNLDTGTALDIETWKKTYLMQ